MRRILWLAYAAVLLGIGCALPTPTPIVVTATMDPTNAPPTAGASDTGTPASTLTPQPTVMPSSTPGFPPAEPSNTPIPTATLEDRFPPADPGPGYTGLIFTEADCWDADLWGMVADARCDFRLDPNLIVVPVNGAQISGHGRPSPPSLLTCMADTLDSAPVAPNTDVFLCLRTNRGNYGYLVQRCDAPGAPVNRLILDYWLYT